MIIILHSKHCTLYWYTIISQTFKYAVDRPRYQQRDIVMNRVAIAAKDLDWLKDLVSQMLRNITVNNLGWYPEKIWILMDLVPDSAGNKFKISD